MKRIRPGSLEEKFAKIYLTRLRRKLPIYMIRTRWAWSSRSSRAAKPCRLFTGKFFSTFSGYGGTSRGLLRPCRGHVLLRGGQGEQRLARHMRGDPRALLQPRGALPMTDWISRVLLEKRLQVWPLPACRQPRLRTSKLGLPAVSEGHGGAHLRLCRRGPAEKGASCRFVCLN